MTLIAKADGHLLYGDDGHLIDQVDCECDCCCIPCQDCLYNCGSIATVTWDFARPANYGTWPAPVQVAYDGLRTGTATGTFFQDDEPSDYFWKGLFTDGNGVACNFFVKRICLGPDAGSWTFSVNGEGGIGDGSIHVEEPYESPFAGGCYSFAVTGQAGDYTLGASDFGGVVGDITLAISNNTCTGRADQ